MNKRLTIGIVLTALAGTMSYVAAGPYDHRHAVAAMRVPPNEILTSVREIGLSPITRAYPRGPYYVLHALDPGGTELLVVADATLGDIVSIEPVYRPRYFAGPRIIHVPRPSEHSERDSDGGEAALPAEEGDAHVLSAPPRHRALRPPAHRKAHRPVRHKAHRAAPPPHARKARARRSIGSAPPQPHRVMSPDYPTPTYAVKQDPPPAIKREPLSGIESETGPPKGDGEKFRGPGEQADRARLPLQAPPPPQEQGVPDQQSMEPAQEQNVERTHEREEVAAPAQQQLSGRR